MSETIEVTRDESVLLIRLNRPKYLNALNSTLARELIDAVAVAVAGKDPVVGAIVLSLLSLYGVLLNLCLFVVARAWFRPPAAMPVAA